MEDNRIIECIERAHYILSNLMAVKPGEEVLIVTDDSRKAIGEALYQAAGNLGCEKILMVMGEREVSGQEPPKAVAAAMKEADVVIAPTAQSLTHTNARIEAAKAGTRVATMPGITEEMFSRGAMTADYTAVEKLTETITEMLTKASSARIEKDGKVLTINLNGRDGVPSPGVYREAGKCGNLPSGEAYIAPLEDGSDGEMIIDGSMVGIGKTYQNLMVDLKPSNEKLVERSKRIIMEATGCSYEIAQETFEECHRHVKVAIIKILLNCTVEEAKSRLESSQGFVKKAIQNQ